MFYVQKKVFTIIKMSIFKSLKNGYFLKGLTYSFGQKI